MRSRTILPLFALLAVGALTPFVVHAGGIMEIIPAFIAGLFIALGGGIASIAVIFFNFATYFGVIKFSEFFGMMPVITTTWAGLRDLANVGLIFMFLAVGIGTVVGNSTYGYKKLLPKLLLVAVFINFSLFAARAVIDVSHVFVEVIYSQLGVDQCNLTGAGGITDQTTATTEKDCSLNYGIGGAFAEQLGLMSFINLPGSANNLADRGDGWSILVFGFMGFLFLTVTAVTFIASAGILISRIIALVYAMVFSPIAAISYALPGGEKTFNKWWDNLLKNAFIAPILFVLLALSLNFARGVFGPNDVNLAAALLTGSADINLFGSIIGFAVVIAFMTTALKMAQDWGVAGAQYSIATAGKWGGALAFGTTARLGQNTIGLAGRSLSRQIREKGKIGFGRVSIPMTTKGIVGRNLDRGGQYIGNRSYDFRRQGEDVTRDSDGKTPIAFGKVVAGKEDREKKQKKAAEDYAKDLGTTYDDRARINAAEAAKKDINIKAEGSLKTAEESKKTKKDAVAGKLTNAQKEVDETNEKIRRNEQQQADLDSEAEKLGVELRKAEQERQEAERRGIAEEIALAKAKVQDFDERRSQAIIAKSELRKEKLEREKEREEKKGEIEKFRTEQKEIDELFTKNKEEILKTQKEELEEQDKIIEHFENRQKLEYADILDRIPPFKTPFFAGIDAEGKLRSNVPGAGANARMQAAASIRKSLNKDTKDKVKRAKELKDAVKEADKILGTPEKKPDGDVY